MSDLVQNKNDITRRGAREQAFSLVFTKMFQPDCTITEIIENSFAADEVEIDNFARKEADGVYDNVDKIDDIITTYLTGWTIKRISKTTLAVLRLAVYEIEFSGDIPAAVAANEAVELAKKFCGDDDPSFVNGVLGSLIRSKKAES